MRQASPMGCDDPGVEWDAHPAFRQMSMAAWFSTLADQQHDLDVVVHEACRVAAVGVRARFAGLLQFRADRRAFVLQAGTGWQGGDAGCVQQAADLTTTAGLAWHTGQLIHFRSLHLYNRVRATEPMHAHGVRSVVSVPIHKGNGEGFGVLEVGSVETQAFTRHDASFLQALGRILADAVERRARVLPSP